MLLIWSGSGALVAVASAGAGLLVALGGSYFGLSAGKALGIGALSAGGLAYLLGRHDAKLHPCSIFFIPLRFYAALTAAAGGLLFLLPGKPDAPEDPKLASIVRSLAAQAPWGSSGGAREVAARYAALKDAELGTDEKRCHLALDSSDLKAVRKAELYVRASKLKERDEAGKRALCEAYLKRLKADFPQAACHVAIRGLFLWGVRGSSPGAIHVDSDDPRF